MYINGNREHETTTPLLKTEKVTWRENLKVEYQKNNDRLLMSGVAIEDFSSSKRVNFFACSFRCYINLEGNRINKSNTVNDKVIKLCCWNLLRLYA